MFRSLLTVVRQGVLISIAVLLSILGGLLLFFSSSRGETTIRSFLTERIGPRLGFDISIGMLETNLFTHVVLDDVTVANHGSEQPPILTFSHAKVAYSLLDLFTFRLTVSDVTIDSLMVHVTRDSTGTLDLPGQEETSGGDSGGRSNPFSFWFGSLTLNDGSIHYDDRALPLDVRLDGFAATLVHQPLEGYRITASADSGYTDIRDMHLPVSDVAVTTRIRGDMVNIEQLSLNAANFALDGNGTFALDKSPPAINAQITGIGDVQAITEVLGSRLPERIRDMNGPIRTTIQISYAEDGFSTSYTADITPFEVGTVAFNELSVKGSFAHRTVTIDSLQLFSSSGGTAYFSGQVALDSLLTHEGSLVIDGFQVARIWRLFRDQDNPYQGVIAGTIATSGPLSTYRDCHAEMDLNISDVSYVGEGFSDIALKARYLERNLTCSLNQNTTIIEGAVALTDTLAGSFSAFIEHARFLNGVLGTHTVDGSVSCEGTLGGKVSEPSLAVSFSGQHATYRDFPIDHLNGSLHFQPGSFVLSETTLDGSINDISTLVFPPLPEGLDGGVTYRATASYVDGLTADIEFDFDNPSYRTFMFDSGASSIAFRDTVVTINSLDLQQDEMRINAAGEYHLKNKLFSTQIAINDSTGHTGSVTLSIDLADSTQKIGDALITSVNLERIHGFSGDLPQMGGVANGRVRFELSEDNQAYSMAAVVDSLSFNGVTIGRLKGAGVLADGTVRVDSLIVETAGNRLIGRGRLVYEEWPENGIKGLSNARTEGRISTANLNLGTLGVYLPVSMSLEGITNANISWDGTVADPWLSGYVRIENGYLKVAAETPPVENIEVQLKFDRSRMTIEQLDATSRDLTVQAWGMIMAHALDDYEGALTIAVNGEDAFSAAGRYRQGGLTGTAAGTGFNLAAIQGFIPSLRNLEGTLQAELAVTGVANLSNLTGYINANELSFSPPGLRERVSKSSLRLTFDKGHVALDTLTAELGGGTISGTGGMAVEGNTPRELNLSLRGQNMNLKDNNAYDIRINDVTVIGAVTDGRIMLEGDLTLGETRFIRNIRTRDIIAMTRKKPERPGRPNPLLDTAQLSIRIHDSEAVWIDNNLAKMRLQPELTIAGSPRAPIITGRLGADEGSLFYLDRKFELTRLYLDFIDPDRNNPLLDIQAETSVRSAQNPGDEPFVITLAITGTAESPRFSLTSNPALDQTDILALLTFGATRSQLAASSGQTEILQSRAELLSSQQLSNYLSREARNLLGIDDLSIQGNLFNTGKASGPQLLASDTINDRLRVTYTTTVGEQNEQSIRLDYRLSRFFSLEGETNQDGDAGLDLKYKFKF